jgi:hypothetical protein
VSRVRRLQAPSARQLVETLCAPASAPQPDLERLVPSLVRRLADVAPAAPQSMRLDAYVAEHGPARFATPFRWSARTARRPLGTGALRRLSTGTSRHLLDAVRDEVDATCDRAQRGLTRRGALGTWLAGAHVAVRATAEIEAVTWATGLCHLVDVDASADRIGVGLPDAWFDVPGTRTTLLGRRDVVAGGGPVAGSSILRLRDGAPGADALDGLLVDGLVAAMLPTARVGGSGPARVLGAWPDVGCVLVVELDEAHVRAAARTLLRCASLAAPAPNRSPARAGASLAA